MPLYFRIQTVQHKILLLHRALYEANVLATEWLLTFFITILLGKDIKQTRFFFRKVSIVLQQLALYYKTNNYHGDL